jgi:hypothetical protein
MFSIGVRYCGGCNPRIDRSRIVRDVRAGLEKSGLKVDFTTDKEQPVDVVLLINGCMHACLEGEYSTSGHDQQLISVRGEMVDDQYIEENHIPEFLVRKILELLSGNTHTSPGLKGES